MKIDVIIPTYNRSSIVVNAIESVLKQTYKDYQLYIVDDGSNDDTLAALERYRIFPNIHILSQVNKGVSSARNLGIHNSKNEWLSFLDSDDEWLPTKLEKQVEYLKKNPTLRFLNNEEIWIRKGVRVNPKVKHQKSNDNIFLRSLDHCLISPSTVIIKRDLLLECGSFDENFIVCEDYDLWLKILAFEPIGFDSEQVAIKNGGHGDQLSTKYVAMDYWRIKSLANLYHSSKSLDQDKKKQIRIVAMKKSEILLRSYLKYNNQEKFEEVSAMIALLNN